MKCNTSDILLEKILSLGGYRIYIILFYVSVKRFLIYKNYIYCKEINCFKKDLQNLNQAAC